MVNNHEARNILNPAAPVSVGKMTSAASYCTMLPHPLTSDRVSFELSEEALQSLRAKLVSTPGLGAFGLRTSKPNSIHGPSCSPHDSEFADWKLKHPCMLKELGAFVAGSRGKRLAVFLDYDGTLTPIVKDPDRAFMSDQMRDIVRNLATLFPTAIISGRGREKVQSFVKLQELFYAGSHGMDISGPQGDRRQSVEQLAFRPAARFEPVMQEVFQWLQQRIKSIPGATVEDNKFCVSVHFRNCEEESWPEVQAVLAEALQMQPELRLSRGRKVLELRPQVEWNKGHAVEHLLGALGLGSYDDVLPLYIGDDRTDEDAFKMLADRSSGFGILVSSRAKPTAAKFTLRDPTEVMTFLERLVSWGSTSDNAWHAARGCIGWKMTAARATTGNGFCRDASSSPPPAKRLSDLQNGHTSLSQLPGNCNGVRQVVNGSSSGRTTAPADGDDCSSLNSDGSGDSTRSDCLLSVRKELDRLKCSSGKGRGESVGQHGSVPPSVTSGLTHPVCSEVERLSLSPFGDALPAKHNSSFFTANPTRAHPNSSHMT